MYRIIKNARRTIAIILALFSLSFVAPSIVLAEDGGKGGTVGGGP